MHCYIEKIVLRNFRSYKYASLDLGGRSVLFVGDNGSGKTTILEAISLIAKANGMRNASICDMQMKSSTTFWSIFYEFFDGLCLNEVHIERDLTRRLIKVNGKDNQAYSLRSGLSSVLWFIPEMDYLFLESPSKRMKFFSRIISMFDKEYAVELIRYNKAKFERSKVLKNREMEDSWLSSIEAIMSFSGLKLSQIRSNIINMLQPFFCDLKFFDHSNVVLSLKSEVLNLIQSDEPHKHYESLLKVNREKDALTGRVSFGAHTDTVKIYDKHSKTDISLYSTGEQKLVLLSILIAAVMCCYSNEHVPILLLDDVFSHFDDEVRTAVMEYLLKINCQIMITDVDLKKFKGYDGAFRIIRVKDDLSLCEL